MPSPKRVLCIMDFVCVGRASLSVASSVLSVCGLQACCLPASLFSAHTGGYGQVERQDTAEFGMRALSHFEREGISFDAVYVGYLYSEDQFSLAQAAFTQYPQALHIVDPALGDEGNLYSGITQRTVLWMKQLASQADVLTPNCTEVAFLCEEEYDDMTPDLFLQSLQQLAGDKTQVVATSVPVPDGREIVGRGPQEDSLYHIPGKQVPGSYPGTGDLFTACLVGLHLKGDTVQKAAEKAAAFVEKAVRATYEGDGEARQGVWYEPLLHLLGEM